MADCCLLPDDEKTLFEVSQTFGEKKKTVLKAPVANANELTAESMHTLHECETDAMKRPFTPSCPR